MNLKLYYQNVRGLRTKTTDFYTSSVASDYEIVAITETWLYDGVRDGELFDSAYVVYREDRDKLVTKKSMGGGVLMAIKRQFCSEKVKLVNVNPSVEILCVKVKLLPKPLFVFTIYIPPNLKIEDYDQLFSYLETLDYVANNNFVIIGDLNINGTKPDIVMRFENFCNLVGGTQYNSITNVNGRTLDVVVSNEQCLVERDRVPFVNEDDNHPSIKVDIEANCSLDTCTSNLDKTYYNFKRADFLTLYYQLEQTDWDVLNAMSDVDEALDKFYEILYSIFDNCVPKVKTKNNKFPPWYTPEIKRDIKAKERSRKLYKNTKIEQCKIDYNNLRSKIKKGIKVAYKNYITNIENTIKHDVKQFWNFVKTKNNNKTGIPREMVLNNEVLSGGESIAQGFANNFKSVFQLPKRIDATPDNGVFDNDELLNIRQISDADVIKAIDKLKPKRTMGHDNVPSYVIKGCKEAFVKPLALIFNLALRNKKFPDKLKIARITPVFKSGDRREVTNYRPIAILSNLSKIFETIIHYYLYEHAKNKISNFQYGFQKKRSVNGNLVDFVNSATDALANNNQMDVIYTDFAKAFDKVDHCILLNKLKNFSISTDLITFMSTYLTNRQQYVMINNFESDYYTSDSGVPQGSNLGPLLFLIFINDIVDKVKYSSVSLFADDMKIFKQIGDYQDCLKLQDDIKEIFNWSVENQLPFNIDKCKVMTITLRKDMTDYKYEIGNKNLERVYAKTDLGVVFDSKLTFNDHVISISNKSYKNLGFILRNCRSFKCEKTILMLYSSFVRSKLDYCSTVWSPFYTKYIQMLENVQKKFIKHINFILQTSNSAYLDHLSNYNLMTLNNRRTYFDIVYLYKLLHNLSYDVTTLNKIIVNVPDERTRFQRTFSYITPTRNYELKSPPVRIAKIYNSLQRYLDIFSDTYGMFTKKLKNKLLNMQNEIEIL